MKCPNCGKDVKNDRDVCPYCGTKLSTCKSALKKWILEPKTVSIFGMYTPNLLSRFCACHHDNGACNNPLLQRKRLSVDDFFFAYNCSGNLDDCEYEIYKNVAGYLDGLSQWPDE